MRDGASSILFVGTVITKMSILVIVCIAQNQIFLTPQRLVHKIVLHVSRLFHQTKDKIVHN